MIAFPKSIMAFAVALAAAQSPAGAMAPAEAPEAPAELHAGEGAWQYEVRPVTLRYMAKAMPRVTLPMASIRCTGGRGADFELLGLIPAQKFPQPWLSVAAGSAALDSRVADASYMVRMQGLDWPPYAKLQMRTGMTHAFLEALRSGATLRANFNGQERRFPPVPAELGAKFAAACLTVPLPIPRRLPAAR